MASTSAGTGRPDEGGAGAGRRESVYALEATPLKFGPGAADEAGYELTRLGVTRALVVTDPAIVETGAVERLEGSLARAGVECEIYAGVRVEPTLASMEEAVAVAQDGRFDGFVGLGGGSSLDTAKVAALVASHPAPILDYVNPPIGEGRRPPAPLRPLLAIPTTGGTGSEATSVAVLDLPEHRVKTGISHRYLRPRQALVDPLLGLTAPGPVAAACGLDVVCHALESFLACPFDSLPAPASPGDRPPYQGANPISDLWSARAVEDAGRYLRRAAREPADLEARSAMMLAASLAGIGFGSAGVHIPHACAYPIAGLRHEFRPPGYPGDHAFVPHGISVIVTAPASFRFTFRSDPDKHRRAAELLAGRELPDADEETLPTLLVSIMQDLGVPRGLRELGYREDDLDDLVDGAAKQQRLLRVAPCECGPDDLAAIFRQSFENW